jgi:hypothetical protein
LYLASPNASIGKKTNGRNHSPMPQPLVLEPLDDELGAGSLVARRVLGGNPDEVRSEVREFVAGSAGVVVRDLGFVVRGLGRHLRVRSVERSSAARKVPSVVPSRSAAEKPNGRSQNGPRPSGYFR